MNTEQLMLLNETIAIYHESHTKHINAWTMHGENAQHSDVQWVLHIVPCFIWFITLYIKQRYVCITKTSFLVECLRYVPVMKDGLVISSFLMTAKLCVTDL